MLKLMRLVLMLVPMLICLWLGAACLMPAIDASKSEIQLEEAEQLDGTRRSYLVFRLACEQRIVEAIDAIISRP